MRKDFYLFRHGETDYNKEHRWQGCGIDVSLNSRGIIQAQELASRLRECRIEHIYSSGLKRALQTAQMVLPPDPYGIFRSCISRTHTVLHTPEKS